MSARNEEFAPHAPVDLRDQNHMFLALEELGIAKMQDVWVRAHDPQNKDAAAVHEQAAEFYADMIELLAGRADKTRFVDNGWAGASLAAHLRAALKQEIRNVLEREGKGRDAEALSDDELIALALEMYLSDLELLTKRDLQEKMMGRKVEPKEYIDFMIGWSGVFCGAAAALTLPTRFLVYKAAASL